MRKTATKVQIRLLSMPDLTKIAEVVIKTTKTLASDKNVQEFLCGTYSDGSDVYTNKENGHWHTLFGKGVGVETSASELTFIPFSSII